MRPMIAYLKRNMDRFLIGAEIGVYRGIHAKEILDSLKIKILFAVDPWIEYDDGNIIKKTVSKERIEDAEQEAKKLLKPYKNLIIIKAFSWDSVNVMPHLDFVYIDGAHDFRSVWRDIRVFSGKAKMLGGHDYNRKNLGVVFAVNIYRLLNIFKSELHTESSDWWFVPRS